MTIASMHDNSGLASSINQAAHEPALSSACYAKLMDTPVFVVLQPNGASLLANDSDLLCWHEGDLPVVPCFTSLCSLRSFLTEMISRDLVPAEEKYSYLQIPITDIFRSASDSAVHVNPLAESECILMPHDIAYLQDSNAESATAEQPPIRGEVDSPTLTLVH